MIEGIVEFKDWQKIDLRVAQILEVKDIEGADKLYKLSVDLGKELGKRIICAGIKEYYAKEELKGKKIIVFSNLTPRKIKGIESQGMLLAAVSEGEKKVVLIKPKSEVSAGEKIEFKEISKSYKFPLSSLPMEENEWMNKSKKDLQAAKNSLKSKDYEWSCFQSQQSSEKALKAVYIKKYKSLLKVHDLVLLAKKVGAPKKIIEYCSQITPSYVDTRYPDISKIYTETDAKNTIELTEKILRWIEKNL